MCACVSTLTLNAYPNSTLTIHTRTVWPSTSTRTRLVFLTLTLDPDPDLDPNPDREPKPALAHRVAVDKHSSLDFARLHLRGDNNQLVRGGARDSAATTYCVRVDV